MMSLEDYLQYEKQKKRKSRESEEQLSKEAGKSRKQRSTEAGKTEKQGKAEKPRGSTVEKQRSEEAKKQTTGEAEKQRTRKAEKQRTIKAEKQGKNRKTKKQRIRNQKKCPKRKTNNSPPKNNPPYWHVWWAMVGHGEPSRFECSLCLPAWPALGFKQTMWFSTMTASLQVERSKKKWSNQSRQYIHIYTWDGNTEVRWSRRGSKASLCKSVLCAQVSVCKSFLYI